MRMNEKELYYSAAQSLFFSLGFEILNNEVNKCKMCKLIIIFFSQHHQHITSHQNKNLYSACSQNVSRALRRRLYINIEQKSMF